MKRFIVQEETGPVCHCTPDWNIIDTFFGKDDYGYNKGKWKFDCKIAAAFEEESAKKIAYALNRLDK